MSELKQLTIDIAIGRISYPGNPRASACICLAAQRAARAFAGGLAVGPHRAAVDEDVLDAGGGGRRRFEGRAIGDGLRVEDGHVGIGARREDAAAGKAEPISGQAGHPAHRFFEAEEAELAAVIAEDAREGAPQPRVRMGVVRQPVRADHRVRKLQHPLDIGLVHHPIDRTRRLQPIGRLLLADPPIGGDRRELAAGLLGRALRPGHQDL